MRRPFSVKLFAVLFGVSAVLSLCLALYAVKFTTFGFVITPEAAKTLALRILAIRISGLVFAAWLMALIVFQRSRAARGALVARWVLGFTTSVAFLRGIDVATPLSGDGSAALIGVSILQLLAECFAIMVLYGDDASDWFESRSSYGRRTA